MLEYVHPGILEQSKGAKTNWKKKVMLWIPSPLILSFRVGAEEGTRTPTGLTLLDPESSASTNSATSADS